MAFWEIMTQTALMDGLRDAPASPDKGILARIGEMVVKPRRPLFCAVFASLAFGISFGLRYWLDDTLPPGFPFVTFYPAILLTSVFAGIRAATLVAAASLLVSWFFFMPPFNTFIPSFSTSVALGFLVVICGTLIGAVAVIKRTMSHLQEEQQRSARLAHARELMFQELQHRISNNLATVAALLRLQAAGISDKKAKQALAAAQVRIGTISRLQRRMHSPNVQHLDLSVFLRDIADDCLEAAGVEKDHKISFALDEVFLTQDQAIMVGLVVSELLMNAVEHGAPKDDDLRIALKMAARHSPTNPDGAQVSICVQDNGPGVSDGFRLEQSKSLGLEIARQFATQLGGTLSIKSGTDGGAVSTLEFIVSAPDAPA